LALFLVFFWSLVFGTLRFGAAAAAYIYDVRYISNDQKTPRTGSLSPSSEQQIHFGKTKLGIGEPKNAVTGATGTAV